MSLPTQISPAIIEFTAVDNARLREENAKLKALLVFQSQLPDSALDENARLTDAC